MERMTTRQIDEISAAVVASESARSSPEDIQEEEETERLEEERLAQEETGAEEEELSSPMDSEDEVGWEHNIER
jgi:RNA recognition motif-containing protein